MEHKIEIVAKDREGFDSTEKLLDKLHPTVYNQIDRAETGPVGLTCYIHNSFEEIQPIPLPEGVTQICHFDDYIGIYCGKYFFKIVLREEDSRRFNYLFGYENKTGDKNEN